MSRELELFQHFMNEHSIMMYKCSKCHKTFASNVSFYSHLKAHKCTPAKFVTNHSISDLPGLIT